MTLPRSLLLVHDLWQARVPLRVLLWRHMLVLGTLLNLLCSLGALALLAVGVDAVWAVVLHFVTLPWNSLLFSALWRHPQSTPGWVLVALVWFMAMLVL